MERAKLREIAVVAMLALATGALTGAVSALLQGAIHGVYRLRWLLMLLPKVVEDYGWAISIGLSATLVPLALYLVRRFAPETSGSGIQEVEGALSGVRELNWKRVLPVKFVAGLCAIGGGFVLGREGPTIQMGANIGKMVSDIFRVKVPISVHGLVAAGAGAGLAATFNAPLAGMIFVIEEMRTHFKFNFITFQMVLISATTANIVSIMIIGRGPDIRMDMFHAPPLESLWLFLAMGLLLGLVGVVFNKLVIWHLDTAHRLFHDKWLVMGILVGGLVGALAWYVPDLAYGGDMVVARVLGGKVAAGSMILLFLLRFEMTLISYGSSLPGGIFAPMVALGTLFGMHFGQLAQPIISVPPEAFAVAGMGALFAATVRAPLTGIVLTVEITGNYHLALPVIVSCIMASIAAQCAGGRPIYSVLLDRTLRLARCPEFR